MLWLIGIGLFLAGLGWRISNERLETVGSICAITGIAMLVVEYWPAR